MEDWGGGDGALKRKHWEKWFNANQLIKLSKYERLFSVLIHF